MFVANVSVSFFLCRESLAIAAQITNSLHACGIVAREDFEWQSVAPCMCRYILHQESRQENRHLKEVCIKCYPSYLCM